MIGSTLKEIGSYEEALDVCLRWMQPEGLFLYDVSKYHLPDRFEEYFGKSPLPYCRETDRFPNIQFDMFLTKRESSGAQKNPMKRLDRRETADKL